MKTGSQVHRFDHGGVERALHRLYARLGSRVMWVAVAYGYLCGIVCGVLVLVLGARFLGLSASQTMWLLPWAPFVFALTLVGLVASRAQMRTVLAWAGERRTRERSAETWLAIVHWRNSVTRVVGAGFIGTPVPAVLTITHFHRPWYGIPMVMVEFAAVFAGIWTVASFGASLIFRPMLEEVAGQLPEDFDPGRRGIALRTKAVGPLPVVTFLTAAVVVAFASHSSNPTARATIATGVALVTVFGAAAIFLVINRSVLAPIDHLIEATERVRAGNITVPVRPLSDDELGTLAVSFNRMLSDLRAQQDELRKSKERIIAATDVERRRIERDLHDGAQQHLVLAQLKLGRALALVREDPAESAAALAEIRGVLDRALREVRELAGGLFPQLLEHDGLPSALREAAAGAAIPTTVLTAGIGRYSSELEAAVYFVCLEALQNAAKHAGSAARAVVRLRDADDMLHFDVADDGAGFDVIRTNTGSGLTNMADRIGALGGRLRIDSAPGQGTTIVASLPLSPAVRKSASSRADPAAAPENSNANQLVRWSRHSGGDAATEIRPVSSSRGNRLLGDSRNQWRVWTNWDQLVR